MSKRFMVGAALAVALIIPAATRAHEGHAHKVMGTVAARHENHLEVKATDGKTETIVLNEKTKVLRGKSAVKTDDIKPGERIVITAMQTKDKEGRPIMVATEVRLGAGSAR